MFFFNESVHLHLLVIGRCIKVEYSFGELLGAFVINFEFDFPRLGIVEFLWVWGTRILQWHWVSIPDLR